MLCKLTNLDSKDLAENVRYLLYEINSIVLINYGKPILILI